MKKSDYIRAVGIVAAMGVIVFAVMAGKNETANESAEALHMSVSSNQQEAIDAATKTVSSEPASEQDDFIQSFRNFIGPLDHVSKKIQMLDKLITVLKNKYPQTWKEEISRYLHMIYPEQAEELLTLFTKLDDYSERMSQEKYSFRLLSGKEKRAALWAIRQEIFGEESLVIWQSELRHQNVGDTLKEIESDQYASFEQKADRYMDAIKDAYGDKSQTYITNHNNELMGAFLRKENIQNDLHNMTASERKSRLRALRQEVGMDEDALSRWEQLDADRENAWETGREYMLERERILSGSADSKQTAKLNELQNQLFGNDAETIRNEEEAGYFRFSARQMIGVN